MREIITTAPRFVVPVTDSDSARQTDAQRDACVYSNDSRRAGTRGVSVPNGSDPRDHPRVQELRRVAGLRCLLFSMQFEPQGGVQVHRCSVNVCASNPVGKIACAKYTINSANEIESIAGRDVW